MKDSEKLPADYYRARQLLVRRSLSTLSGSWAGSWRESLTKYLEWLWRREIEAEARAINGGGGGG